MAERDAAVAPTAVDPATARRHGPPSGPLRRRPRLSGQGGQGGQGRQGGQGGPGGKGGDRRLCVLFCPSCTVLPLHSCS